MGKHEPYWNTCIVKVWLTFYFFEFEEEMFQILIRVGIKKKVAKCLVIKFLKKN